jgi:hypothetical protein
MNSTLNTFFLHQNRTLPTDPNSECVANLPVCDCTDPGKADVSIATTLRVSEKLILPVEKCNPAAIVRARHKGHSTTRACREQGKLPI